MNNDVFEAYLETLLLTPEELAEARQAALKVAAACRAVFRPDDPPHAPQHQPGAFLRDDFLITGGVGKRTAIRPLSAIDLLYVLPGPAHSVQDPPNPDTLRRMAEGIRAHLPAAPLQAFSGGLVATVDEVAVAVIPAFEAGGAFQVPHGRGWRITSPVAEMAALRLSDSLSNGRTTQLLALLKAWARVSEAPIGSFALETLAREFLAEAPRPAGWADLLSDFFVWSRQRTPKSFEAPGGMASVEIDDAWHGAAEAAYWRIVLAKRNAGSGDAEAELAEWRKLFGPRFATPRSLDIWDIKPDMG